MALHPRDHHVPTATLRCGMARFKFPLHRLRSFEEDTIAIYCQSAEAQRIRNVHSIHAEGILSTGLLTASNASTQRLRGTHNIPDDDGVAGRIGDDRTAR
jgi:hypothetical protein